MGIFKKALDTIEKPGKLFQKIAQKTALPIVKSFATPFAAFSESVRGLTGTKQSKLEKGLTKATFGDVAPGTKERAGQYLQSAGAAATLLPAAGAGTRLAQGALVGGTTSAGSAAEAGKSKEAIAYEGFKGVAVGLAFSAAAEGVSALVRSRFARNYASKEFNQQLRVDTKTRQKELELQFRDGLDRYSEKIQAEYGPSTLNGYIKKADATIQKYGDLYRKHLRTNYDDVLVLSDDVAGTISDDYSKLTLNYMGEKEVSMMDNLFKNYGISGSQTPERVLDIKIKLGQDISKSQWKKIVAGEPVSDSVKMKHLLYRSLKESLERMNPKDSFLQVANKKMSSAFDLRAYAAVKKDILNTGKIAGTTEAMNWIQRAIAKTVGSTPVKTTIGSAILSSRATPTGTPIRNIIRQGLIRAASPKSEVKQLNGFSPLEDQNITNEQYMQQLMQQGFKPL